MLVRSDNGINSTPSLIMLELTDEVKNFIKEGKCLNINLLTLTIKIISFLELKSAVAQILNKLREVDVRLTEVRKSLIPMSDASVKLLPRMPLQTVQDVVALEEQLTAEPEITSVLVRIYFNKDE